MNAIEHIQTMIRITGRETLVRELNQEYSLQKVESSSEEGNYFLFQKRTIERNRAAFFMRYHKEKPGKVSEGIPDQGCRQ
jgi:hypothetical protein